VSDYLSARDDHGAPQTTPQRRHRRSSRPPFGYISVAELAARAQRAKSVLYADIERGRLRCHTWRGKKYIAEADAIVWLSPALLEPDPPTGDTAAPVGGAHHG
jgi:hypothetical protein